jgi:ADP-ribosylglycohydrolase
MNTDLIKGMFAGFSLGDALGAPHEFACNKSNVYTGKLELQAFRYNRFTNTTTYFDIGTITDDTEMTIALWRTIEDSEYSKEKALLSYLKWANSKCPHLGKNTRALFTGVKTVRGYNNRYQKMLQGEISQSNGSLMRCSPLALVNDWEKACIEDCDLSNPNPINRGCSLIYLSWLTALLAGKEPDQDYSELDIDPEALDTITEVFRETNRKVSGKTKGWVLHAIWCANLALSWTGSFTTLMENIITKGGDTDTNAAIAGAVYGARVGFNELMEEQRENWGVLINSEGITKQIDNGRGDYCPTVFNEM